jgi:rhomboid protease GluP
MWGRQTTGSVVCTSCGRLVGVQDDRCFNCGRWNPGLWGYAPLLRRLGNDLGFVQMVLWGCVGLYAATLLVDPQSIGGGGLFSFFSPSRRSLFIFGASGSLPVFVGGRWWTVLSAAWLHGGLLHLVFNMLWVRDLAPATAAVYGAGRLVIVYSLSSIAGFALSSLGGNAFTVGASAPIFGLLGALVYAGRRGIATQLSRQARFYAIVLFVFGFVMPGIDNLAHLGGFVGGFLTAAVLNPSRPERFEHLIGALVLVLANVGSILVSLLHGLTFFPA